MGSLVSIEWKGAERRKSPRNKDEEELKNFARYILCEFFNGNSEPYFDHIAPDAVFLSNGTKMLVNSEAILDYASVYDGHGSRVLDEEFFCKTIADGFAYVYGVLRIGDCIAGLTARLRFTLLFNTLGPEPMIIHQHNSYDVFNAEGSPQQNFDFDTMAFVKSIIANRSSERTSFTSGGESIWLGYDEIVYIQSVGKHTKIVCMDKVISCDTPIGKVISELPKRFVQVHRCYIVNSKHISAIRRCEVELAKQVKIPIPESRYSDVRRELLSLA